MYRPEDSSIAGLPIDAVSDNETLKVLSSELTPQVPNKTAPLALFFEPLPIEHEKYDAEALSPTATELLLDVAAELPRLTQLAPVAVPPIVKLLVPVAVFVKASFQVPSPPRNFVLSVAAGAGTAPMTPAFVPSAPVIAI